MSLAVKTEDSDCYLAIRFVSAGRVDHSLSFIRYYYYKINKPGLRRLCTPSTCFRPLFLTVASFSIAIIM